MRTRGLALAAAVTVSALAVPAATAWGATERFDDKTQPTKSSSDISWVEVTNDRAEDHFKVKVAIDQIRIGTTLTVYVDRRIKNPGPELRMVAVPDSEWALYRVNKWGQRGREIDTCGRVRMSSFDREHRATWHATRSCLNLHGAVRVAAKTVDPNGNVDWAPSRQTFYPRVSAG